MAIVKNAVKAMEASMTPEQIHRARTDAEREILAMRLAELRERRGSPLAEPPVRRGARQGGDFGARGARGE